MSYLLNNMNEKQQQAIRQTEGPLLVMAGAGSGKTRVLTHRIAYLIEEKRVNPWNILAITFTNKAAREMRERLEVLIGSTSRDMWVSTFHSMCVRILRREAEMIGYSKQFTIIDTAEQKSLMKRILKDLNYSSDKFNEKVILNVISDAKNQMVSAEQFKREASHYFDDVLADCYLEYEKRLMKNQSFDFDDLIMKTVELFKQRPDILEQYQQKFHYIHVDEYQDTNRAQYELVLQLSQYFKNICVVGDADQSIYAWRGADMHNILNFEKDFPNAVTVLLEQNYRSTQTILNAANDVIANNEERVPKNLWTNNEKGEGITFYRAFSETDEASFVASKIKHFLQDTFVKTYQDIAVLYRTNAQSRILEDAFMKHQLPYKIIGGLRFYDRAEIKDIIAYLRLIANTDDDLSFERIINVPKRSIGKSSVEKLRQFAQIHQVSLFKAAENVLATDLSVKAQKSVLSFVRIIEQCRDNSEQLSVTEMVDKIMMLTGYMEALSNEGTIEAQTRIENIEEFKSVTKVFDDRELEDDDLTKLVQFLSDVTLDNAEEEENNQDAITLMTLHAAKGLEFPIVFLVGLEETIFPTSRSVFEDDIEEERRLMYVGITRAEKKLILTNAQSRLLYGKTHRHAPSRFIEEIEQSRLEHARKEDGVFPRARQTFVQKKVVQRQGDKTVAWAVGDKINHNKWGIGRIVRISGADDDKKLDIAFEGQGIKTLLASFAPITKV